MDATTAAMSDDELRAEVRDWLAINWRGNLGEPQQYIATPAYRPPGSTSSSSSCWSA